MNRFVACLLALVFAAVWMPAAAEDGTIRYADRGDQVVRLQQRLIDLGFLNDTADGQYGKKTEAAIRAFHEILIARAGGNPADASGRSISAEDLAILYADPFSFYVSDLKNGDSGSEVERLQRALIRLNYMEGEADGYFADYTEAAVKLFQQLNSLTVTGVADKATQDLAASGGVRSDHPAYRDLKEGDKGESVRAIQQTLVRLGLMEAPDDGYLGSDTIDALTRFQEYMAKHGVAIDFPESGVADAALQQTLAEDLPVFLTGLSSGTKEAAEVRRLQRRLNALGYLDRRTIDGKYGSGTRDAVKTFQTNNGLSPTGEADEATQKALYADDPVGMLTKYRLHISLDEQRVYVYELVGTQYVEIKNFVCSTGLGNSTPRGVFTHTIPGRRWHYFKEFSIWAQYAYSIEGNILFHSVLFNNKGGKPTYASVNNLGRRASHGCVRLEVENAKWIYENCARGTVVTIN